MRKERGIALITVLLATTLLLALLAFLVNIGTSGLRRATEEQWELQAQAGADAGVGWVRALLDQRQGDVVATLGDMAAAHSLYTVTIDERTQVQARVAIRLDTAGTSNDHLDVNLQQNPNIDETPLQVGVTATVVIDGTPVATRSTTALVRVFRRFAPYSETVGVIDNSGPVGVESPGDPAGQPGGSLATDLRIHVFKTGAGGEPVPADSYADQQWWDGNSAPSGALP
ncbi:MAG TPA: hypothetical protein VGX02_08435 [Candidatus Eremiobacteraceae bacterium]|jgi:hypothetical protein|nr:hypothetical protein [Candidatus Eremiobacteraceae bacterium]